jgi:hypothetical protein
LTITHTIEDQAAVRHYGEDQSRLLVSGNLAYPSTARRRSPTGGAAAQRRSERVDAWFVVGVFAFQFFYPRPVVRLASSFSSSRSTSSWRTDLRSKRNGSAFRRIRSRTQQMHDCFNPRLKGLHEQENAVCGESCPKVDPGTMSIEGRTPKIWSLSKKDAHYGPAPAQDVRCDHCKFMFPPLALGGCRFVRGVISGAASCKEFVPRKPDRVEAES